MSLDSRKEQLLALIVEHYVGTKEPIGSKYIVDNNLMTVSGATIRNEMRALEEMGFLTHPYTSAGRIPTEQGYQYYVEHLMQPGKVQKHIDNALQAILDDEANNRKIKDLAKTIAEHTGNAVIIASGSGHIYYTGISKLFAQPEFADASRTVEVSQVFDHCEQHLPAVHAAVEGSDIHVFIGEQNPMGASCGLVAARVGGEHMVMMLGPQRMDYALNVSLLDYIQSLFR